MAVGAQVAPDQNLALNEEIIVKNSGGTGHQKRLLSGLSPNRRRYLFHQKLIVRQHDQRTAGGIAPFIAEQFSRLGHLEIGFLLGLGRRSCLLKLTLDDAVTVLLLNTKAFRYDALSFDEDAERSGVDNLFGRTRLLFLVAGRRRSAGLASTGERSESSDCQHKHHYFQ